MSLFHIEDTLRYKYRTPDIFKLSFEYDCIIAKSPLEAPQLAPNPPTSFDDGTKELPDWLKAWDRRWEN